MASEDLPKFSEHERARRQEIIDAQWEAHLLALEHRRAQAERSSFHKAPGDPDFNLLATGGDY